MNYGFCGNILKVNLSTKETSLEKPKEIFYRRYLGGEAFVAYYLLKELNPGVNPFSPDNLLIFANGVLTGHPFSGSGRNCVGAKSPLTGGFGCSEVGGYWGSELKRAGYDAIVIKGCCEEPSFLWIDDKKIEFLDAQHLWNKTTGEVDDILKKELDQNIRIAQIGPAGERKIRYACVINDLTHAAGRTGMGAVMGSKKLKAIVVHGSHSPSMANPEKVREKGRWVAENPTINLTMGKSIETFHKYGTGVVLLGLNESGGLPTKNFSEGTFDYAEEISGERMAETILINTHTCFACTIRCKRTVQVNDGYKVDPKYGGPEYETIASFGSNCGIHDLKAISKAHEICNANGLDTISTGVSISFAMECFKEGLLTEKDTEGVKLEFGNSKAMIHMLTKIVERQGLGDILGEGVKKASLKLGKGAGRFALHVKGQEIPMHEPRLKKALGIGYAVSPTGADHCHNFHDTAYEKWNDNMKDIQALGCLEPMPTNLLTPEKIRFLVYGSNWRHLTNSLVICYFTPWSYGNTPELVNAVTGWNTTMWELMKVAERAATMARIFNIREGFKSDDDILPERFSTPFKSGPVAGEKISHREVDHNKEIYYGMMGWDGKGIPTPHKLYELDIGWGIDHLP